MYKRQIQRIAEEMGVAIMSAPVDTYAAGKLISQCAPISYYMTRSDIMKFTLVTPVADVTRVMAKVRHRYFPILDEDGKYCGMISRRNIINLQKRRIILVDHNEATQAVEGFDQAEILEIIDHHRIGSLETSGPVYFRNQPVGCTATIITQMYDENDVEIPPQTAGLLLAAILSDTLAFRSPTCTAVDVNAANRLAGIAGVDIDVYKRQVVDDARMGVTEVVRGADLLSSTARQLYLYRLLGLPAPKFAHCPLLLAPDGRRLSKRDGDQSLENLRAKYTAEEIVGRLAFAYGLQPEPAPRTPESLIPDFSWDKVPKQDICLPENLF